MNSNNQIFLNEKYISESEAEISILDRGFLFGDGVYELIPVYNGKPFLLNDHLDRLDASLSLIGMKKYTSQTLSISKIIAEIISKNNLSNSFVYIQITRGIQNQRQHVFNTKINPTVLVMSQNYKTFNDEEIKKGFKAVIHDDYRWSRANIKCTSLLGNVLLKNYAENNDAYETILTRDKKITEGSASNVFFVKNKEILTPKLGNNILSGITRNLILATLNKNKFNTQECDIHVDDIENMDEVWCSSSTNSVVPIIKINNKDVGTGKVGNFSKEIHRLIQEYISKY